MPQFFTHEELELLQDCVEKARDKQDHGSSDEEKFSNLLNKTDKFWVEPSKIFQENGDFNPAIRNQVSEIVQRAIDSILDLYEYNGGEVFAGKELKFLRYNILFDEMLSLSLLHRASNKRKRNRQPCEKCGIQHATFRDCPEEE